MQQSSQQRASLANLTMKECSKTAYIRKNTTNLTASMTYIQPCYHGCGSLTLSPHQCTLQTTSMATGLGCQLTNPPSHVNAHGSLETGGRASLLQFTLGVGQPPAVQFTVMFPVELRVSSILRDSGHRYVKPSLVLLGTIRNGFSVQ